MGEDSQPTDLRPAYLERCDLVNVDRGLSGHPSNTGGPARSQAQGARNPRGDHSRISAGVEEEPDPGPPTPDDVALVPGKAQTSFGSDFAH